MVDEELGDVLGKDQQRFTSIEEQIGPSNIQTYFELPIQRVAAAFANIRSNKETYSGSTVFILGHGSFGVLGSQELGGSGVVTRLAETALFRELTIDFTSTTYKDAGSTTASWETSGSVEFGVGDVIQTINVGSDIQLSTTDINRCTYTPTGSFTHLMSGSFSSDNGVNWVTANPNEEVLIVSSSAGSEVLFKAVDSTGSVVLHEMILRFKQDDF